MFRHLVGSTAEVVQLFADLAEVRRPVRHEEDPIGEAVALGPPVFGQTQVFMALTGDPSTTPPLRVDSMLLLAPAWALAVAHLI